MGEVGLFRRQCAEQGEDSFGEDGVFTSGREKAGNDPNYITKANVCKKLIPYYIYTGDIQVLIKPPPTSRTNGLTHSLVTHGTLTALKFQLWPPWDWVYIGKHLKDLESFVLERDLEGGIDGGQVRFW